MVDFESGLQESKQTLWKDLHPDRHAARQHSRRNYNKFLLPLLPQQSGCYIPSTKIPNSTLTDKRRRCSKDGTYALENSNSISEYTSAAIVVSGSTPYPITRQAREKNPNKKKEKKTPTFRDLST
jgi:hypothetical protein